jgi:hypothetical protein
MRSPLHQYPVDENLPLDQPFAEHAFMAEPHDLGWNDMGNDVPAQPADDLTPFAEQQAPERADPERADVVAISDQIEIPQSHGLPVAKPDVVLRQEAMARLICRAPGSRRPRGTALVEGRRASFTLRLDAERHAAVRLVCSLRNRSAQILLTEALDKFLADIPEVSALAEQIKPQE